MLKKLKASLGFGSASVDAVLDKSSLYQGESVSGIVYVKGGDIEQNIEAIELKLCTEIKVETENGSRYENFTLAKIAVNTPFIIQAGEEKSFNFTLPLHGETPITATNAKRNQTKVWIETNLDIAFALDPKDRDFIEIKPLACIQTVLDLFEEQGFTLVKADVEKGYLNGGHFKSKSGCYQELEFQRRSFWGLKEIELSFILEQERVHCLVEIDGVGGRKDSYRSFSLTRLASEEEIRDSLMPLF